MNILGGCLLAFGLWLVLVILIIIFVHGATKDDDD